MSLYNVVASSEDCTVVSEYKPEKKRSEAYQSEADLEGEFVRLLSEQGYEYLSINSEAELISNLRRQLEALNNYAFTDGEWDRFFAGNIANANDGIEEKARKIQDDYIQVLKRDDGSSKNIYLIDKTHIHNNRLQVINQYVNNDGNHDNRYDVSILVNGLPLVHTELKCRGKSLREAFNQIDRYQRDSFWAGSGLYEFVQVFIISNGTHTKYYSNTTRHSHIVELQDDGKRKSRHTSNSFEFTSFWADANNKVISDLIDFTKTFLSKHTLLSILTRYCVFTSENILLVMRPYQIAATERILSQIEVSTNYKQWGTVNGGGYIWHTTGSGKTLTSFKTAQLASKISYIEKVLFVVDRKDLDYQTMKEYDRFEKGAANSNTSTKILQKQMESSDARIIITTIQKLDKFISANPGHAVFNKHIVLVFDECHRSQFGEMHEKITKAFKRYHLFGFTGTPIFPSNAASQNKPTMRTTEQAFGRRLHTYTVVDAVNDGNVLPFRIDYIRTMRTASGIDDKKVPAIDKERALLGPERIREIVSYILEHFDQKTKRNTKSYSISRLQNVSAVAQAKNRNSAEDKKEIVRVKGFNSILAVSSIDAAKLYYAEFKKQMAENPENAIKIATIYSYGANEDIESGILCEENSEGTDSLDASSRDFLDFAIADYNIMFKTNYDTSSDKFQNYYKDVSLRMKNREIDLLIVVNMFLTGFDATTLNTLWVDKNLKYHGLIQAFSRTNRILNSVKTFGNIVCFRDLQEETDEAIALFGDKDSGGIILLKGYKDYYYGSSNGDEKEKGYLSVIDDLTSKFSPEVEIVGEAREKEFIRLYGTVLRLKNILSAFDEFEGNEILSEREFQDYQSVYIDLYQKWKARRENEREIVNDDIVFELELIRQVEINIDYILMLVKKYHSQNCLDEKAKGAIERAIGSSIQLRSKKELIEQFIDSINPASIIDEEWKMFICNQLKSDIETLITEEKLKPEEARSFVDNAFRDGAMKTTGTDTDKIMPPVSRFGGGNRGETKKRVINKLLSLFEKYSGLL